LYEYIKETQLNKENSNVEIKSRRWILLLTIVALAMFSNSILIFFEIIPFYPSSACLFSLSIILLSIYALGNISIFKTQKVKYAKSNLNINEVDQYYKKLKDIIEEDKLYLDAELTLTKLSELVGISTKQLSQIINQTEKVNFSQYISNYR
jgi:capsular polysaccharide biosynthesis protein